VHVEALPLQRYGRREAANAAAYDKDLQNGST
jgi:hypothetical protein